MNMQDKLARLHAAKIAEDAAREKRIALEEAIAEAYRDQIPPEGGTRTFTEGAIKFSVQCKFNLRCTDADALEAVDSKLVAIKKTVNETAYKALWETNKDAALKASLYVIATPAKPRVTIKSVKEDTNGL